MNIKLWAYVGKVLAVVAASAVLFCLGVPKAHASRDFQKGIKSVVVEVKAGTFSKEVDGVLGTIASGYFKNFLGVDLRFPVHEKDVQKWVLDILNEEIATSEKIRALSMGDEKLGLYTDGAYKDKISTLFDFKYFPPENFNPPLNYGVVAITNKQKRLLSLNMGVVEGLVERKVDREYGPFLVSVSKDKKEFENNLKEEIRYICRKFIAEPINCANGGVYKKE